MYCVCEATSVHKRSEASPGWGKGLGHWSSICTVLLSVLSKVRGLEPPGEQGSHGICISSFQVFGSSFWSGLLVNWSFIPLNSPAIHSSQDEWLICFSEHLRKGHHMLFFSLLHYSVSGSQVVKGHFFLNPSFTTDTLLPHQFWFPHIFFAGDREPSWLSFILQLFLIFESCHWIFGVHETTGLMAQLVEE